MSKRRWCMVRIVKEYENGTRTHNRCGNKIKPGSPFCKEHALTHRLVRVECTGEAHSNPFIDHCMMCMPFWGSYPVAIPKDAPGEPWVEASWE